MSTEAEVRQHVDDLLTHAGWNQEQGNLIKEHQLPGIPKRTHETQVTYGMERERSDYTLLGSHGKPIAVLEIKRDRRDPLEGLRQVENYADHLFALYHTRPFIFLSNGYEHWFWDREQKTEFFDY
jgi:type I restriction enzyme R subunit